MADPNIATAATARVQRYYNKASGKMETPQAMHAYRPPAGHQVSKTTRTVTREPSPAPPQQSRSLIQMTPREIEAHAARIVGAELEAERLPFQQRSIALRGEQIARQSAHQATYAQQDTTLQNMQTHQGESAKTYQNLAADAVKKAAEAAPGVAEAAEHLGGAEPESLKRQREAARTLLTGIAAAGQTGTNARQEAEGAYLTNSRANALQESVFGGKQIDSEYGKRQQENAEHENQITGRRAGATSKLAQTLFGEQEKLKIAAAGLGIKEGNLQRQNAETESNIQNRGATQKLNARKLQVDENYKQANAGTKATKDALDIEAKKLGIKKLLEGSPGAGGKPLTKPQITKYSTELSSAFNVFRRAREAGASPQSIREALEQGGHRHVPSEKEIAAEEKQRGYNFSSKELENKRKGIWLKNPVVKNPVFLKAAEEIMQKEYIGTDTKKELRGMGLPDSGWSERFLGKPSATRGVRGGVNAGIKRKK